MNVLLQRDFIGSHLPGSYFWIFQKKTVLFLAGVWGGVFFFKQKFCLSSNLTCSPGLGPRADSYLKVNLRKMLSVLSNSFGIENVSLQTFCV